MDCRKKTCLVILTGWLVAGCAGAGHQLPAVSEQESARAAQRIAAAPSLEMTTRSMSENEEIARRVLSDLQTVARPICDAIEWGRCWYTLEYSPQGQMNAFVIKNQIVLFDGLVQYLETEDEIAVVLAHEMGHDIAGHYEKSAFNRTIGGVVAGVIFAGIAGATNAYGSNSSRAQSDMEAVMELGEALGDISFSKEHETEADYIAAYILARAGYNPDVAGNVWIKFAKASGNMETRLFGSHPAGPDRLAVWEKTVDEVRHSADLMPNLAGADKEIGLQQARVFNDPTVYPSGGESGVAIASSSYRVEPESAPASGMALAAYTTRGSPANWAGNGHYDTCGAEWVFELQTKGSELRGNMWWKGVKYDVYGNIDSTGRKGSARAGKSKEAHAMPAPRFFRLDIVFEGDTAHGHYAIDSQTALCQADFALARNPT